MWYQDSVTIDLGPYYGSRVWKLSGLRRIVDPTGRRILFQSFSTSGIRIPGSPKVYRVLGTCHHIGSRVSGHWFTKVFTTQDTWFALDDLQSKSGVTQPPGINDSTVVILVLMAEDLPA